MNQSNYHGLWIPKSILTDRRLSKTEMLIYAIVDALDNANGCFASNAYIAEQVGLDERNVRANLMRLEQAGYIVRMEEANGRRRIQTVANKTLRDAKANGSSPQCLADCYTSIDANPNGEDASIRGEDENIRGGGCQHPPYSIEDNIDIVTIPKSLSNQDDVNGMPKTPKYPYDGEAFSKAWLEWTDYRKEAKKKLTLKTVAAQFKLLASLKSEKLAIECIEQSIRNGWAGLFPKNNNTKQSTTKTQHTNGF
jgi:DNA-binding MarR family transcriptional regulator